MSRRAALLLTGSFLVFLTVMRYGVAALGWVVFAAFLLYTGESPTLKSAVRTDLIAPLLALAFIGVVAFRVAAATRLPRLALRPALGR